MATELVSLAMRVAVGPDDDAFAVRESALEALLHHASEAKRRKLRIVQAAQLARIPAELEPRAA